MSLKPCVAVWKHYRDAFLPCMCCDIYICILLHCDVCIGRCFSHRVVNWQPMQEWLENCTFNGRLKSAYGTSPLVCFDSILHAHNDTSATVQAGVVDVISITVCILEATERCSLNRIRICVHVQYMCSDSRQQASGGCCDDDPSPPLGACSLVIMVLGLGPGACFAFRYYQHLPQWPV